MKRLKRLMGIGIVGAVLLSGVVTTGFDVPVAAAETDVSDGWSDTKDLKKTIITDESFDSGFSFAQYNALENGTWEAYCGSTGDDGKTVSIRGGKVILTPDEGIPSGIRYKYPSRGGVTVFAVTARRHDSKTYGTDERNSKNMLKINVCYDKENKYSYTGTDGGTTAYVGMNPAINDTEGTATLTDPDYNRTVTGYFSVKTDDSKLRRKYLNKEIMQWNDWYARECVATPDGDEDMWDTVSIFSTGAAYEIESVKVISYAGPGPIYFNEGFEDMGADASLTGAELAAKLGDRGVTFYSGSTLPQTFLSIGTADGSSYLQLGTDVDRAKNAMAQVTSVKIPSLTELDNSTSEFYVRMKLKTAATTEEIKNENVTYMYIQFGKSRFVVENKRMGGIKVDKKGQYVTYTNDEELVKQDVWTTAEFHIKGGKASLTITREGGEPVEICEGAGPEAQSSAKYQVYIYGARLCIEDLQIYTPGICFTGAEIQRTDVGGVVGRLNVVGNTENEAELNRKLTGILAIYDNEGITRKAAYVTATVGEILFGGGALSVYVDDLPGEAAYAGFYLWDGIGETEMQPLDELEYAVRAKL